MCNIREIVTSYPTLPAAYLKGGCIFTGVSGETHDRQTGDASAVFVTVYSDCQRWTIKIVKGCGFSLGYLIND